MSHSVIVGLGPVALATARLLEKNGREYSFLARRNDQAESRQAALEKEGIPFRSLPSRPELATWDGTVNGQVRFLDRPDAVAADLLLLAVPHTAYEAVLSSLDLAHYKAIILLNPCLGSSSRVRALVGHDRVLCLANFWGAAKFLEDTVLLKALKKRIAIGSSDQELLERVSQLFESAGLETTPCSSCLEAELRNITLYVHPVFCLAPLSLKAAFEIDPTPKYLYKLFPEGPIERRRTELYARFADEVMEVGSILGARSFNLLAFLHRDNYQVPDCFLEPQEVDQYPEFDSRRRGDLLYARYSGLLVDSHSEPDEKGHYFDFSAVPIEKVSFSSGKALVPRLLGESLFQVMVLRQLGAQLPLATPALDQLWQDYCCTTEALPEIQRLALSRYLKPLQQTAEETARSLSSTVEVARL